MRYELQSVASGGRSHVTHMVRVAVETTDRVVITMHMLNCLLSHARAYIPVSNVVAMHMLSCLLLRARNTQCVADKYLWFRREDVVVLPGTMAITNVKRYGGGCMVVIP